MTAQSIETVATEATTPAHGAEITVPLNRLKASPKNARKTPHSPATIEAFAASIKAKGVLQPPVVEIERDGEGVPTGSYLVSIGEGRRQGLRLLAKRKAIKRTHPVRVIVDAENDAHEISLDENMTREAMHPADQFEAFQRLAVEKGYGPEEIGARFGVSAHVVRQRLRLGSAAPELMAAYRAGTLALDQLSAFCVSEDQDRQRQVLEQVGPHTPAYAIRRAMTEAKVSVGDRRVRFVGVETYKAEGGGILRDLFTEDGGGWLEDVVLLDRLVGEKLSGLADEAREREGWKWAEPALDYPDVSAFGRVYPVAVERSEADAAEITALSEEYDRIVSEAGAEGLSPEEDARLEEIDKSLQAFGPDFDYAAEAKARAGVVVMLGHDGLARFERGLVRAEDAVAPPPEEEAVEDCGGDADAERGGRAPEPEEVGSALSDRLVIDLTAHKTMGLRDAVQADVGAALATVVHALALQVFYPGYGLWTPLQLRLSVSGLERLAPGVDDGPAGRRVRDRCEAWGARLPERAEDLWGVVFGLAPSDQLDLMACCAGVGLYAVRDPHDRRPGALAQAETLATVVGLDMAGTWSATAASYFTRVPKTRVLEAVTEAVNAEEAGRIAGFKKGDMAEAAERLVEGKGWLPPVLRTVSDAAEPEDESASEPRDDDAYAFAAE
ncbi:MULTISPECIES: ParB/RepB/Spo0J family partition protein [Brevundimonas]|jgi:ParB family transcriptional regulator, chromosome partitioning protein|uniref:ParB N-terminal domain-containing protein n=2 Tax=Brevundimonas TaxID=41275 RepID=A0AB37E420_9CAUL|nr:MULTISPECIES: ParB/RepB/Spo0J family partition protein [Brevundimonas]EDX81619.1 ParB-like nuclease domain family [Brevundimonas sp. BAL3]MBA4332407.1 chromosome partitioning protein ParB [Brevundimonas sp.]QIH71904.1 ParB N-terminal domain-containing protein [Brevundimonas mediterranea]QYC12003.1 ParB/RepB/Spo0J family partition protein [Brevundimonas nasdae]QYC14790.1 ParB/RepB/Spo0J family partition protein [Brevundimonas nasdae]